MLAFASLPPAGPLHLPLSGSTAERIVAALLAKDEAARREELQFALSHDPAFALWAVLVVERTSGPARRDLSALGQWLAGKILDELHWPAEAALSALEIPAARRKKQAALAAESIGIARVAADVAERHSLDPGQAELLGLLCHAGQWISLGHSDESPDPDPAATLLPTWLAESLDDIARAESTATSPAGCVALAQRIIKARVRGAKLPPGLKFDRRRHLAATDAAAREWLKPSPACGWLPKLAQKLRELVALQSNFNHLVETEKLESLKELAQGAGHEINNPLANISARAQTLLNDEHDPERRRMLAAINTQAFRAHEMIADMMLFARPPRPERKPTGVAALVNALADQFRAQAEAQQVRLVWHAENATIMADIDATQIHEALAAVVTNSLEALVTGGSIEIAVAQPNDSPDSVKVTITDNGPGIPAEVRRHLFDPFYSGREAGRGIGFGLSKCWRIVRLHGGQVEVECPPPCGTRFIITLPAAAPPLTA
jgi:signal transduction histidine kinase